jgi:DNA-binding transcriptional ArsR family regulator
MERFRDLSGNPAAMLALAHPTRLALLELLGAEGPLTATEAGKRLDESPGTMSWHLRLLARHGFVVEAEGGRGRRRPWTLAALGTRWDPQPRTEMERAASDLLLSMAVERAISQLRAWLAVRQLAPPAWQHAAAVSDWTLYLTAAELQEVREQIYRLLEEFSHRIEHPTRRPAGAVAVRALISIFPQDIVNPDPAT